MEERDRDREEAGDAPAAQVGTDGPPAGIPPIAGPLEGREIARLVGAGLIHFDPALTVDEADAAAHKLLATAPGRLLGRSPMEAFLDRHVERLLETALSEGSATAEVTLRDGGTRTAILHARGEPDGSVWLVIQDVSELRRLQRIRSEFIDNLSHELRTPLSAIALLAETLASESDAVGGALPPRIRERIAKIEVETGNLAQMVDEMLDLSRIESGGLMRLDDVVDVRTLAAEAARRLGPLAERQGVALRVQTATDVPRIRGNAQRLGQVLSNLIHNAVKFSPDGGDVVIRVVAGPAEVIVTVEDHGIGIARHDQPRIFERFYKADRARVRGGGTGLGLSIARHIVEAHGGRISVTSDVGRGSTFAVSLPLVVTGAADDGPAGGAAGAAEER